MSDERSRLLRFKEGKENDRVTLEKKKNFLILLNYSIARKRWTLLKVRCCVHARLISSLEEFVYLLGAIPHNNYRAAYHSNTTPCFNSTERIALYVTKMIFIRHIITKHYPINVIRNLSRTDGKFPLPSNAIDANAFHIWWYNERVDESTESSATFVLRSELVRAGKEPLTSKYACCAAIALICITWPILHANFQCQSCEIISWYICK